MNDSQAPTLIFDFGNVILPFDPLKPCRVLAEKAGLSTEEVCDLVYRNNLERWFEQGLIDGHEFTERVATATGLALEHDRFRALWADMFVENTDVSAIIRRLKPNHQLLLLSNTNEWHWTYAAAKFPILALFEQTVLSYQVGVLKPHPAIYRAALELVEGDRRTIFIDDIATNVDGASMLGITGVQFRTAEQLETDLINLGCKLS